MNVLFLTLVKFNSIKDRGIYSDLLRQFIKNGHCLYVVMPTERRENKKTNLKIEKGCEILEVQTLNIQKTNVIEKGIATIMLEDQYLKAIKKYFNTKFDLILYSTPPITFSKIIEYIKKRDQAYSYLLLKDIFPQNAVDMKMIKERSLLHKFFLNKEKKLYRLSNTIGCMSEANCQYIIRHHPDIPTSKLEVNPNSIEPISINYSSEDKNNIREKYKLPLDKIVFVYGGNLGIPQGIDFLIETIENCENKDAFFLIIGSGTEFKRIENWFFLNNPKNAKLYKHLPKEDYDRLLGACDVGLIFLNKNFTIPNFPSRLLSYLEMKMPIIASTDTNTDIGEVITNAGCGYWCESGDSEKMQCYINELCLKNELFNQMRENSWQLLINNYTSQISYNLIINRLKIK